MSTITAAARTPAAAWPPGGAAGAGLPDGELLASMGIDAEEPGADAQLHITVSADLMQAWLSIEPPRGGRPASEEQVRLELARQSVTHGIREAELRQAVAAGACSELLVAVGCAPQPGQPTRFECLLHARHGAAADNEAIDFREMGELITVAAGAPLMRRTPAVPGVPGIDVRGHPVPVPVLIDLPFEKVSGAGPAPGDAELLVASLAGIPSIAARGVNINPKVELKNVDLATGNVSFEGTVHIKGDIRTGMGVKVSGDVYVDGTIEAADVVAGGHVIVRGGIIGRVGDDGATAHVQCKGDVQARFMQQAHIEAGGNVSGESGIRDCEVIAGGTVTVGASGTLVGGHVAAHRHVKAPVLGAAWGARTVVKVGVNPFLVARLEDLEGQRRQRHDEETKLHKLLAFVAAQPQRAPPDTREKAERTLEVCQAHQADIGVEIAGVHQQLVVSDTAGVDVARVLHGGVSVLIGHAALLLSDDRQGGRVRLVDGHVVIL